MDKMFCLLLIAPRGHKGIYRNQIKRLQVSHGHGQLDVTKVSFIMLAISSNRRPENSLLWLATILIKLCVSLMRLRRTRRDGLFMQGRHWDDQSISADVVYPSVDFFVSSLCGEEAERRYNTHSFQLLFAAANLREKSLSFVSHPWCLSLPIMRRYKTNWPHITEPKVSTL